MTQLINYLLLYTVCVTLGSILMNIIMYHSIRPRKLVVKLSKSFNVGMVVGVVCCLLFSFIDLLSK